MSSMNFFMQYTGLVKGIGKDCVDFLNRMTTNELRGISDNDNVKTVLTSDKGRIIDLLTIFKRDGGIYLKTSFYYETKVIDYLNKFVVMDDASFEKCTGQYVNFIVTGDAKEEAIRKVKDYESRLKQEPSEKNQLFYYTDDFGFKSLDIVCHIDKSHEIRSLLSEGTFQTCLDYEFMRISAGQPEAKGELNEEINPLECGLKQYVSFTKGCYVGQEVIARLDSQGKLPKQMVVITSEGGIIPGAIICDDNDVECGFVSSSVNNGESEIALGFIRSVNLDFQKHYRCMSDGKLININIQKINQTT